MNKRKILFLEQYSKISGAQKVLLALISELKNVYDCYVVVPEKNELTRKLEKLNLKYFVFSIGYYGIGKKSIFDFLNYFIRFPYLAHRLVKLIKKLNPDLVYANAARTFPWATLACQIADIPMIWHIHSIFDKCLIKSACIVFGKNKAVKKIIAVSNAAAAPLTGLNKKLEVIYNAIDTGEYFPAETKSGALREFIKLKSGYLVAMAGLLLKWKGIEDFIIAAELVVRDFPQTKFIIAGDTLYDKEGKIFKDYLIKMVKDLNLDNNVFFLGFRDDIPEIMRQLDVFVLPSKQPDPCPTSLLQAMACGAAVIATNFGGPAEIISDNVDGFLCEPNDPRDLAAKISYLIKNPDIVNNASLMAARKIKKSFNHCDYIKRIKMIIDTAF